MSSLTIAYKVAQKGLALTESKLGVVSQNINNANVTGYTEKSYQTSYITADAVTTPSGGSIIQTTIDSALSKQVNTEATGYSYDQVMSNYLNDYSDSYGSTSDSATTLSSTLDSFTAAMNALQSDPTQTSSKASVVATAQQVASQLNGLSTSLQGQRQQADNAIGTAVDSVNTDLQTIASLNKQISDAQANNDSAADLVDQRNTALLDLTQKMGVQYFTNSSNEMQVYTNDGSLLVSGSYSSSMSYEPTGTVSSSTSYPGGFAPITLNGTDVTTKLSSGTLGALVTLRDTTLPNEQAKLDNMATTLATTVNTVLNAGASNPPANSLTGNTSVSASTALSATGTWRVAVTDQGGAVQSYADLDLSTFATVGDLVTALNGISGVSASITGNGNLQIAASTSADGISLNEMTSSIGGLGASQYFGMNSLFVGNGSNPVTSTNIQVNQAYVTNSTTLPTGTLASGTLAAGDEGVSGGDGSTITALLDAMNAGQSFSAAGGFASRTTTLSNYANSILSTAATMASSAQTNANTSQATYTYLTNKYTNETGVNVDEETANMTSLQTNYEATATLLTTIRDMFKTLISAVST